MVPDKEDEIDNWDDRGLTPLMHAVLDQDEVRVRQLIEQGAMVDRIGVADSTALRFAAWKGAANIVRILLEAGANVNMPEWYTSTALYAAAHTGSLETILLLLERGAYVNAGNRYGATPLFAAAGSRKRCTECVQVLLDWGARVNVVTYNRNESVLEEAARRGNVEMVRILLAHGADARLGKPLPRTLYYRDDPGFDDFLSVEETPQQFQERYEQVIAMLIQAGAKTQDEIDAEAQARRAKR